MFIMLILVACLNMPTYLPNHTHFYIEILTKVRDRIIPFLCKVIFSHFSNTQKGYFTKIASQMPKLHSLQATGKHQEIIVTLGSQNIKSVAMAIVLERLKPKVNKLQILSGQNYAEDFMKIHAQVQAKKKFKSLRHQKLKSVAMATVVVRQQAKGKKLQILLG